MLPRPAPALARAVLVTAALAATPAAAHAASGGVSATTATTAAPAATATTTAAKATPASGAATTSAPAAAPRAVNQRPSPWAFVRTSAARITVRASPSATASVGTLKANARYRVRCQVNSVPAAGKYGTSRIWNRVILANGKTGYVPDAASETASKVALVAPYCGAPDPAPAPTNPGQGRCMSVASVALVPAPPTRAAFIAQAGPLARDSQAATNVPAAVTLAQGILESASGTLTAGANNYFGIKAKLVSPGVYAWGAQAVGCVHKPTNEVESGRTVRQIGQFRMYPGMRESFDDHGLFLVQNSRYAPAFKVADDPEKFAQAIAKAGYATDPSYSSLLIKLMNDPVLPLKPWDQ